jgi:hypothetical protein
LKKKISLGGSEYSGGLEGRAEGGAVVTGVLSLERGFFWSSFPMFILWLTKNGQCLSIQMAIMEPFWVVLEIKENLYIGDLSSLLQKMSNWSMVL